MCLCTYVFQTKSSVKWKLMHSQNKMSLQSRHKIQKNKNEIEKTVKDEFTFATTWIQIVVNSTEIWKITPRWREAATTHNTNNNYNKMWSGNIATISPSHIIFHTPKRVDRGSWLGVECAIRPYPYGMWHNWELQ